MTAGSANALALSKSILDRSFELSAEEVFALGSQAHIQATYGHKDQQGKGGERADHAQLLRQHGEHAGAKRHPKGQRRRVRRDVWNIHRWVTMA